MNGQYNPGDTVLANWKLTRLVGEGSFGRVFEAEREDFGRIYKSAIKIITVPQNSSEIMSVMDDGMDEESVTAYFRSFVEELVDEFTLMSKLKGKSNLVSYEDHTVIRHTEGIGWDIFIRMELLTPLLAYARGRTLARKDIMQLGIDMCRALEVCQKFNIIHRDIKPENIFISELGDYKLGDFGIARTVEKTTGGLSKKGTYTYMAPEVYRGEAYGSSVDIYSLGIVLYRMLNDNRTPFLPDYPAPITHGDREKAMAKRMSGMQLPTPKNADGRLAEIVLKACSQNPKERYSTPMQMCGELEAIMYLPDESRDIYPQGDNVPLKSIDDIEPDAPGQEHHEHEKTESIFGSADQHGPAVGKPSEPAAKPLGKPSDAPRFAMPNTEEPRMQHPQQDKTVSLFASSEDARELPRSSAAAAPRAPKPKAFAAPPEQQPAFQEEYEPASRRVRLLSIIVLAAVFVVVPVVIVLTIMFS